MNDLERAIYEALTGDSELMASVTGVYNTVAPRSAVAPFVVFSHQSGVDAYTMTQRAMREYLYTVKCVAEGPSSAAAGSVYELIDGVLFDVTMDDVLYVRREQDVKYSEVVDGREYWHVGGQYRLMVGG